MSQIINDIFYLPRPLALRARAAARQQNSSWPDFIALILGAYISDPHCARLAMPPLMGDASHETDLEIARDLYNRALAMHGPRTSFDEILARALYAHFDTLDAEPQSMRLELTLAQDDHDRIAAFARQHAFTPEETIRRALADLVFNPAALLTPPPIADGAAVYKGTIQLGEGLQAQMQGILNRASLSGRPTSSTALLQTAVAHYLAAIPGGLVPPPASAEASPQADRPVITPTQRAQSKRLRL